MSVVQTYQSTVHPKTAQPVTVQVRRDGDGHRIRVDVPPLDLSVAEAVPLAFEITALMRRAAAKVTALEVAR